MARKSLPADAAPDRATLEAAGPGRFGLAGDVGFGSAARLLAEGESAFGALDRVEVDLAGVTRIDSAGLALLLEWVLSARAGGRSLSYLNVPPAAASLAGISDVSAVLGVPDSPDG